jgi:hypothetical protein
MSLVRREFDEAILVLHPRTFRASTGTACFTSIAVKHIVEFSNKRLNRFNLPYVLSEICSTVLLVAEVES